MSPNPQSERASKSGAATAWAFLAVGLLALGVMTGALATRNPGSWAFPAAGFTAFVLAFRQGLLARHPEGLDRIWRVADRKRGVPRPPAPEHPRNAERPARVLPGIFRSRGVETNQDAERRHH
ncbi:MAG TPA: hypothetical protein VEO37_06765 [Thermoanaerobaculia bacterium]|nr:hypothetical protein [Thermoanaerobaculia bacterium]